MRTFLTVLGIVIGIASVIIVFSAGEGIKGLIVGQIESYGTDIIVVEVRVPSNKQGISKDTQSGVSMVQGVQVTTLNLDDVMDINKLPNIKNSYGAVTGQEKVSYGNESKRVLVYGVGSEYVDIDKGKVEFGRFFTEEEDKTLTKVVVLGSEVKKKLFGENDAIDRSINIHNSKYRVVGVMGERGAVMGMNYDEFVYVPIRTLQKRVMGIEHILYSVHQLNTLDIGEQTADEIRSILRENHDIVEPEDKSDTSKDDFRVTTMTEMLEMFDVVTNAITWLLLAIVAISLVVGGVGIMNIMYVIVTERTSEIGLRKAVGAKTDDILFQFLIESVLITVLGGIFGIIGGVSVSYLIAEVANRIGFDWAFFIPVRAYVVAIIFSIFFGVVFGLYPAKKAAALNPIDALRKE